jgi:DoxX-like family
LSAGDFRGGIMQEWHDAFARGFAQKLRTPNTFGESIMTTVSRSEQTIAIYGPSEVSSKTMRRAGYALTTLAVLFLLMDSVMKLLAVPIVLQSIAELGYPASASFARTLGLVLLIATLSYLHPRTAKLGAVLLTAYLGGAVATHVRVGSLLFTHTLFGVYVGLIVWGGLWLRDARLRALFPWRHEAPVTRAVS